MFNQKSISFVKALFFIFDKDPDSINLGSSLEVNDSHHNVKKVR